MGREGIKSYYKLKIEELETIKTEKVMNLRRLEAQRNELNSKGTRCLFTSRSRGEKEKQSDMSCLALVLLVLLFFSSCFFFLFFFASSFFFDRSISPPAQGRVAVASRAGIVCG